MMKFAAFAISTLSVVSARDVVSETWDKAGSVLANAEETLSEVRKHAEEAAAREAEEVTAAKKSMRDSEKELEKSAQAFKDAEEKLMESSQESTGEKVPEASSSFIEFPDSFRQFPGVKEDMEAVKKAEKRFKETMSKLRSQDDDLMKMARQNFADAGKVISKIGGLHSGSPGSLLEEKRSSSMPESFRKVLEAEENLKKINDGIAKEFHLAM